MKTQKKQPQPRSSPLHAANLSPKEFMAEQRAVIKEIKSWTAEEIAGTPIEQLAFPLEIAVHETDGDERPLNMFAKFADPPVDGRLISTACVNIRGARLILSGHISRELALECVAELARLIETYWAALNFHVVAPEALSEEISREQHKARQRKGVRS